MYKRILIIDDEVAILEAMQAMLEDVGYRVDISDRGEYIQHLSVDNLPDLILLDLLISGADGRELTRMLKSQPETSCIPIIMLSAHPSAGKVSQEVGADAFIAKPFEMDELLDTIQRLLLNSR